MNEASEHSNEAPKHTVNILSSLIHGGETVDSPFASQ